MLVITDGTADRMIWHNLSFPVIRCCNKWFMRKHKMYFKFLNRFCTSVHAHQVSRHNSSQTQHMIKPISK